MFQAYHAISRGLKAAAEHGFVASDCDKELTFGLGLPADCLSQYDEALAVDSKDPYLWQTVHTEGPVDEITTAGGDQETEICTDSDENVSFEDEDLSSSSSFSDEIVLGVSLKLHHVLTESSKSSSPSDRSKSLPEKRIPLLFSSFGDSFCKQVSDISERLQLNAKRQFVSENKLYSLKPYLVKSAFYIQGNILRSGYNSNDFSSKTNMLRRQYSIQKCASLRSNTVCKNVEKNMDVSEMSEVVIRNTEGVETASSSKVVSDVPVYEEEIESNPCVIQTSPISPNASHETLSPQNLSSNNRFGRKIHACRFENCDRVYGKSSHLKAHMRRHTGEKPYECTWPGCSWSFSRSDELTRHYRSHNGVKPYACAVCEKRFARSDHVTKHLRVHHKEKKEITVDTTE